MSGDRAPVAPPDASGGSIFAKMMGAAWRWS